MIEFVTLYLGLVVGLQPLEVSVGRDVASVEVVLDGEPVTTLYGPPWQTTFDFGPRLQPHHLVAIAYDEDEEELTRAEQWLNLPRRRAEAKLSLQTGSDGLKSARVIWESVDVETPRDVRAFLDGKEIEVDDPQRIELPRTNPERIHFLNAELEFSDSVTARAELVFGGTYGDQVSTELTSVVLETDRSRPPRPAQLEGRLFHRGKPLRVVAVDRPPLEIIVVREHSEGMFQSIQRLVTTAGAQRVSLRAQLTRILRPADRVRFALTATAQTDGPASRYEQIPVTPDLTQPVDATLFQILSRLGPMGTRHALTRERLADAVSIAGLVAADSNRRRAVILLSAFESDDVSRLQPAMVRDYLNSLTVPLVVWQLRAPGAEKRALDNRWGPSTDVTDWGGLSKAFQELWETLDSQVVVWVEGRHLQREISIAPSAKGLRLAQRSSPELSAELQRLAVSPIPAAAPTEAEHATRFDGGSRLTLVDGDRLAHALGRLGTPRSVVSAGPVQIISDADAPPLLADLELLARQVPELYSNHYQLPTSLEGGATVVMFRNETDYREYESAIGVSVDELSGHASPGMIVLFAGDRTPREVHSTFIHEMAHLLSLRLFGSNLPPWLDEGLAEAMTFASAKANAPLSLGPLDPRRLRLEARGAMTGPLTLLGELAEDARKSKLVSLAELTALDRAAFEDVEAGRRLYALSSLWVHFLSTVDTSTAPAFRRYLADLSQRPPDAGAVPGLLPTLDDDPEQLEARFRSWLQWLAAEVFGA